MKKFLNAIRDFLYNITDYGLIITVIVVMALILGWRFDILFNRGIEKNVIANLPEIIENQDKPDTENNPSLPDSNVELGENNEVPQEQTETQNGLIATINIPAGSYPSTIGEILLDSNLITDKNQFLSRSVELGLDTKLRSGKYDIEVGTSLDNIIKIIANAQ